MKKSILLEAICSRAKELAESNQQHFVDSDYFLLAMIDVCTGDINVEGVNEAELRKTQEMYILKLCAKLKPPKTHEEIFAELIKEMGKETKGQQDNVVFSKHEMNAEIKARLNAREEITADLILDKIFSEPSACLSRLLENNKIAFDEDSDPIDFSLIPDGGNPLEEIEALGSSKEEDENDEDAFLFDDEEDDEDRALNELLKGIGFDEDDEDEVPNGFKSERLLRLVQRSKMAQMELLEKVKGQDHAVTSFISGYFNAELASFSRQGKTNKPKATFLFAGPPGVGKTFLAEQTAKILSLPFKRFDMSEYCENESNIEFCGSDKVYKNGKPGNVTSYVAKNPNSIILFDEIEKAHISIIYLFLQILDAGYVRDNFTDQEVSFENAILIFTTNAGKSLYEDAEVENLSAVPRKQVLNALAMDKNSSGNALFPPAICSRFASGNVIMFNRLNAHNLLTIARREFERVADSFKTSTDKQVTLDNKALHALMYAEGGNVDARTIKGRASNFFNDEIYELFRLLTTNDRLELIKSIKEIKFQIDIPEEEEIRTLFEEEDNADILLFGRQDIGEKCKKALDGRNVYCTDSIDEAEQLLFDKDIALLLVDIHSGIKCDKTGVLNIEDTESMAMDFLEYAIAKVKKPVFILDENFGDISQEEALSFMRRGANGVIALNGDEETSFANKISERCIMATQQHKLNTLARANKILSFNTDQRVSEDGETATITLFDFKLEMSPDVEDSKNIIGDVSRPNVKFDDVIGAKDAKGELKYFVEYLKDPVTFMRKGVKAPKGMLLYGPPGTGKTLLAKAMAGESDVTFIAVEGNAFLKKWVGEGPELVHQYFRLARKYAPSILFVDEIDAIGKNRNSANGTSGDVDAILTAFLTEMDGFKTRADKPVFVLAATNYNVDHEDGRSLDPALLRRFDRRILVDLPSKEERHQYITQMLSDKPNFRVSEDCIENIAIRSVNMSLADLESVIEFAMRNAIKAKDCIIDDKGFDDAFETFTSGEEKKWDMSQLERVARHEAGHALVSWLSGDKPSYLTIVARGEHGGYMQHGSKAERKGVRTRNELLADIRTSMAGRAAEVVYYGEEDGVSTGASGDLYSATRIAENMICRYGMDETVGLSSTSNSSVNRQRVNEILEHEYKNAKYLIAKNKDAIDALVKALLEKNQLKENEIDEILKNNICEQDK